MWLFRVFGLMIDKLAKGRSVFILWQLDNLANKLPNYLIAYFLNILIKKLFK